MAKVKRICKGLSRRTGLPCKNKAVEGSAYCKFHGGGALGNRGGGSRGKRPKPEGAGGPAYGNTNGLKHGAYTVKLLSDEQPYFEAIKAEFEQELGGPDKLSASDRLLVFRLAANAAKLTGSIEKGAPPEALLQRHRMELDLLRELKTTRATKGDPSTGGNTPAEFVADLLERMRQRSIEVQTPAPALQGSNDEGDVIDAEVVDEDQRDDG
jgi:hypothetical protein